MSRPGRNNDIGSRLSILRLDRLLTLREMAAQLGINCSQINRWEKGSVNPNYSTIRKLAKYFDVDPHWLAYGVMSGEVADEHLVETSPKLDASLDIRTLCEPTSGEGQVSEDPEAELNPDKTQT